MSETSRPSSAARGGERSLQKREQASREQVWQQLRQSLRGPVQTQHRPTLGYRLAVLAAFLVVVVLVLVYFSLLLAAGALVAWYSLHFPEVASSADSVRAGLLAVLVPIVGGSAMFVALLKPLLAGESSDQEQRYLKREAEPFLFEWVQRIAEAVGAPAPSAIAVDCRVNAGASYRGGVLGAWRNDLVLTIGLPLVEGLTVRQLTGVLAHELGHFSQGWARRCGAAAQAVLQWFGRAVYERDEWDEWLARWSTQGTSYNMVPLLLARFVVWLTRKLLFCFLWVGHAVTFYLFRQREYDADQYEAYVAGSECFSRTMSRMVELEVGRLAAVDDLASLWEEGRLVDSLPSLIVANRELIDERTQRRLRRLVESEREGVFSTHPAMRKRVAFVRSLQAPGLLQLPPQLERAPARVLFRNYERLAKAATLLFYRRALDKPIEPERLCPTEEVLRRRQEERAIAKTLARFFQVKLPPFRPLPLPKSLTDPPQDVPAELRELKAARQEMLHLLPRARAILKEYSDTQSELNELLVVATFKQAGVSLFRVRLKNKRLRWLSLTKVNERRDGLQRKLGRLSGHLYHFEAAVARRMAAALRLLQVPSVQRKVERGQDRQFEVYSLQDDVQFLGSLADELGPLHAAVKRALLLTHVLSQEQHPAAAERLLETVRLLYDRLVHYYQHMGTRLYPLDHAQRDLQLRDYLIPELPDEAEWSVIPAVDTFLDRFQLLYSRLYARLAVAAEQVELALGLPRLPDPKPEEDEDEED